MKNQIQHKGVIERIEKDCITVRIEQIAACVACAAQRYCNSSDKQEKTIEVIHPTPSHYRVGQEVTIIGALSTGMKAVWMAYCIPLVLLMFTLFVVLWVTDNEPMAALAALAILVPYYVGLYLFRDKLKRKFTFTLR